MDGRKPKTVDEHKRSGTYRADRHAARVPIVPIDGIPPAPADFNDEARHWWNHFCADIQKTSALAEQHLNAVRLMAQLMCDRKKLDDDLQKNGFTFHTETGLIKQNPAFSLRKQIDDQLIRLFEQFGFTLRSGMTIKAPDQPKTSTILEMMKGRQIKKVV